MTADVERMRAAEARFDAMPYQQFPRRGWWLRKRAQLLPWCMFRGCWRRSYASPTGRRGNVCPMHLWQTLQNVLKDDSD